MKKFFLSAIIMMVCAISANATLEVATFENAEYPGTGIETSEEAPYWYGWGSAEENYWMSGNYQFVTFVDDYYAPAYYYYEFIVTRDKSTKYTDYQHAYRSAAGGAYEGDNFAVWTNNWYGNSPVEPLEATIIPGFFICNCVYTVSSMNYGDGYAKKFGKEDWLKLTITGEKGGVKGNSVEFYLAKDGEYVSEWTYVDLSSLGEVDGVTFEMSSTDNSYGMMNTPAYFCMDNFGAEKPAAYVEPARAKFLEFATFEDITIAHADTCWQGADVPAIGWNNWKSGDYAFQTYFGGNSGYGDYYSAFTVTNETANTSTGSAEPYRSAKGGAYEGENFAVWNLNYYGADSLKFAAQDVKGFFINNTAYAVNSMCYGDSYTKKFGEDDWFLLTINGSKDGVEVNAEVEFYLAKDGKYVNEWTYVDLTPLGEVDAITFTMSSSDNSYGYMNTPAYFCMDNFGAEKPAGYVAPEMVEFPKDVTAIENTEAAVKAVKVVRDGQVLIIRDGKAYNVLGAQL